MFKRNNRGDQELTRTGYAVLAALAVVLIIGIVALTGLTRVKFGTVKVVTRMGALTDRVLPPGLHYKTPFVNGVEKVRTVVLTYETSDHPNESGADFTDYAVTAQTVDGQQITIKYSVQFRVSDPLFVLEHYGHEREVVENIVKAHSRSTSRTVAQQYSADQLYGGTGIYQYSNQVAYTGIVIVGEDGQKVHYPGLDQEFSENGLTLEEFLVRKISFSEEYINSIEQQQIEEENIETAKYRAEQAEYKKQEAIRQAEADAERTKLQAAADKERNIALAEAEAERTRLQADADRDRVKAEADAEAYSIEKRGAALRANPELIQWEFVKGLDGVTWGIMPDGAVTPLLPVPTGQ